MSEVWDNTPDQKCQLLPSNQVKNENYMHIPDKRSKPPGRAPAFQSQVQL